VLGKLDRSNLPLNYPSCGQGFVGQKREGMRVLPFALGSWWEERRGIGKVKSRHREPVKEMAEE